MSILIDIQPLQYSSRDAGIGVHIRSLLRKLRRLQVDVPVTLLLNDHAGRTCHLKLHRSIDWPRQVLRRSNRTDITPWQNEKFSYAQIFNSGEFSVCHANSIAEHHHVTIPIPSSGCKVVVTVHDLIPLIFRDHHPEYWTAEMLGYDYGKRLEDVQKADAVLTVSEHSKTDLIRYLGIPEDKIHVTYGAVSTDFRPTEDRERIERVRRQYQLPDEYILYVGGYYGFRKNIANLLKAYHHYVNMTPSTPLNLVLVGATSSRDFKIFHPLCEELHLDRYVRLTEFVAEQDLPVVYSEARVFFYPSLYEGFGQTPLQAMASGTVVVTSDNSSLPEVTGNAAKIINPEDIEDMAQGLLSMCMDEDLQSRFVALGLERVRRFSWEDTAAKTLNVYRSLMN